MHIYIKNKKLSIGHYKVKCSIGKRGIGNKKREGDFITPKGKFKIKCIFYRKDRIPDFKTKISYFPIRKNMGWCDDPRSWKYNQLIEFPNKFKAEKLYRVDSIYDIILVLDYNTNPVKKNKGSAIFIHIAKRDYRSTAGCVALKKRDLKKIVSIINKKTIVSIS